MIEISIVTVVAIFLYFSALYVSVKVKYANLQSGTLIYKDFIGKTRQLHEYFKLIEPDMKDYYLDNDFQIKFPLVALYQHTLAYLSSPRDFKCSIGFYIPVSNDKIEKFFKKEGYSIVKLPSITKCISCEFPFRADIPPIYPLISMKLNPALRVFMRKNELEINEKQVCMEMYFKDLKKMVTYVPLENYEQFHLNKLRMPSD